MESVNEFLSSPLGMILAAVAAFLAGSLLFSVKQWEAHWKQWAIDTSKAMSKCGLVHTPKLLDALAVGDLAGAFREIKGLADVFKDPKQLAAEFESVFQSLLDAALKDPTQAKSLQQLANDAVAAFASGDPAKSAGQLAADAQAAFQASPLAGMNAPPSLVASLLPHLPALAGDPATQNLAGLLSQLGMGSLLPAFLAGKSASPASAPSAVASPDAAPAANGSTGLTVTASNAMPGHVITVSAAPGSPAAAAVAPSTAS